MSNSNDRYFPDDILDNCEELLPYLFELVFHLSLKIIKSLSHNLLLDHILLLCISFWFLTFILDSLSYELYQSRLFHFMDLIIRYGRFGLSFLDLFGNLRLPNN